MEDSFMKKKHLCLFALCAIVVVLLMRCRMVNVNGKTHIAYHSFFDSNHITNSARKDVQEQLYDAFGEEYKDKLIYEDDNITVVEKLSFSEGYIGKSLSQDTYFTYDIIIEREVKSSKTTESAKKVITVVGVDPGGQANDERAHLFLDEEHITTSGDQSIFEF